MMKIQIHRSTKPAMSLIISKEFAASAPLFPSVWTINCINCIFSRGRVHSAVRPDLEKVGTEWERQVDSRTEACRQPLGLISVGLLSCRLPCMLVCLERSAYICIVYTGVALQGLYCLTSWIWKQMNVLKIILSYYITFYCFRINQHNFIVYIYNGS